jgi:hypothetical protein
MFWYYLKVKLFYCRHTPGCHHACGKKHKGKGTRRILIPQISFRYSEGSSEIFSNLPKVLPNGSAAIATGEADAYLCTCHSAMTAAGMNPGVTRAAADDVIFKMFL